MFLFFWVAWALFGLAVATALLWWSVKTRQFEQGRRAAMLPLEDENEDEDEEGIDTSGEGESPAARGRVVWVTVLVAMFFGLATAVILLVQAFS
jgi:nitrogen fixation-related uncharacterized protein